MKLHVTIPKKEIVYEGKVKKTGPGQGYIHMNDKYIGHRAYIIFPQKKVIDGTNYLITIDEVMNKGVHPNNDHTCKINLSQKYVGKKCIVILDDDWE